MPTLNTVAHSAIFGVLLSGLAACGSGSSENVSLVRTDQSLAEVTADYDKPQLVLPAEQSDTSGQNSGGDSQLGISSEQLPQSSAAAGSFVLRRFLWKPVAERDGNVVVLIDRPGVRVEVYGSISETLTDFGPSNDRGTTARGDQPGCRYGTNVQVEFFDASSGARLAYIDGQTSVTVADGCGRVEFDL